VGFLMLALGMTVFFAGRFLGAWVDNKWGAGRRIGA
jgi:hypothetical protein